MAEQYDIQKLKKYMKDNFDYSGLKKCGVFKDIKHNEYIAQAERIKKFFGLQSIYDYGKYGIDTGCGDFFINGKFKDTVNQDGEFRHGGGFHISLSAQEVDVPNCPICSYDKNTALVYSSSKSSKVFNCGGCKRPLQIIYENKQFNVYER